MKNANSDTPSQQPARSCGGVLEIKGNMEHPQRKENRLKGYDYGSAGAYFITVCTKGRAFLLWKSETYQNILQRMKAFMPVGADTIRPLLSDYGVKVDQAINEMRCHYPEIKIDSYVIMPNHVHILLMTNARSKPISTIIGQMKRSASMAIGEGIWQKSFHDHIVRDENDLQRIRQYIESNPAHWAEDRYYIHPS